MELEPNEMSVESDTDSNKENDNDSERDTDMATEGSSTQEEFDGSDDDFQLRTNAEGQLVPVKNRTARPESDYYNLASDLYTSSSANSFQSSKFLDPEIYLNSANQHLGNNRPEEEPCLFLVIYLSKNDIDSIKEAISLWNYKYFTNKLCAMKSTCELIMHSAGYKKMSPFISDDFEIFHFLGRNEFDELLGNVDAEPMVNDDAYVESLKVFFKGTFVNETVIPDILNNLLQHSVLHDLKLLQDLYQLLKALTESKWKAVRLTGAVFAGIIIYCYGVLYEFVDEHVAATAHCSVKDNPVIPLRTRIVKSPMLFSFYEMFLLSLLDVDLVVRKKTTVLYWKLMLQFPSLLMCYGNLKGVYWTLFDESAAIRTIAVKNLVQVCTDDKFVSFTGNFLNVILPYFHMRIYDVNETVASETLQGLAAILKKYPSILPLNSLGSMTTLMLSGSNQVVKNAAKLLYQEITQKCLPADTIKALSIFVEVSQDSVKRDCCNKIVEVLMPIGKETLTNWDMWCSILLQQDPSTEPDSDVISKIFCCVMQESTYFRGELCSNFPVDEIVHLNEKELAELQACIENQSSLTHFATSFLPILWENYKTEESKLQHLVKIPCYCDIEILDLDQLILYLINMNCFSENCIRSIYSSLATLFKRMRLTSPLLGNVADRYQELLFKNVGSEFARACQAIAMNWRNEHSSTSSLVILKATTLARFFPLSKSGFNKQAFEALKLGFVTRNTQVVNAALSMCFNIVQFQVLEIESRPIDDDEVYRYADDIECLERNVTKLISLLRSLFTFTKNNVKFHVSSVLSQLYLLFHPKAKIVNKPLVERIEPTLVDCEWLNFHLFLCGIHLEMISDYATYVLIENTLKNFCLLMICEVLPLDYLCAVLPFFTQYEYPQDRNFNEVLESSFKKLRKFKIFPRHFAMALGLHIENHSIEVTKKIVRGFIHVFVMKLPPEERRKLAVEIVGNSLHWIATNKSYLLFEVIIEFVSLHSLEQVSNLITTVSDRSRFPVDEEYVIEFCDEIRALCPDVREEQESDDE